MALRGLQQFLCFPKKRENKKVMDKTKDLITSQIQMRKDLYTLISTSIENYLGERSKKSSRVISPDAIENFTRQYEYNATCGSLLELFFFQRFWMTLSKYVPTSILPCTLTAVGLLVNFISFFLLLIHAPEIPAWVSVFSAVCLFLYQTLDALDGKQAIKLQNTHLEELADHGSDSLSTTLLILSVALTMKLTPTWTFAFCLVGLVAFYSVHWQTHATNVVVFGYIDVTEIQISMISVHLLTAIFGQGLWSSIITTNGLELRQLVVIFSIVCASIAIISNLSTVFSGKRPLDSVAEIPRRQGWIVVYPSVPLVAWIFLSVLTIHLHSRISPVLLCFMDGIIFTKMLIKLQVATMGSTNCPLVDTIFLAPVMLIVLDQWMSTSTAFACILTCVVLDLIRFVTFLAWDVCDFQDIYIFSLKFPVGHPRNRAGNHGFYLNGINNAEILKSNLQKQTNDL